MDLQCYVHSDNLMFSQARWYLRAAEGGYVRAMYNTSLCYLSGEGFTQSHRQARKWMKRAADHGHSKAQFEHGLGLFAVRCVAIIQKLCAVSNFL